MIGVVSTFALPFQTRSIFGVYRNIGYRTDLLRLHRSTDGVPCPPKVYMLSAGNIAIRNSDNYNNVDV